MTTETHYQRIAREQAERQAARAEQRRSKRRRRHNYGGPSYTHNSGPSFPRDPDGLDRDDLGLSPDY